jgi:hypothetical protein
MKTVATASHWQNRAFIILSVSPASAAHAALARTGRDVSAPQLGSPQMVCVITVAK